MKWFLSGQMGNAMVKMKNNFITLYHVLNAVCTQDGPIIKCSCWWWACLFIHLHRCLWMFFICCKVQWSDLRAFLGNEPRRKSASLENDRVCDPQSWLPKINVVFEWKEFKNPLILPPCWEVGHPAILIDEKRVKLLVQDPIATSRQGSY